MNQELKTIKKKYGEHFMHLCRELFPTILEKEGKLLEILDANFAMPKYLYEDIMEKSAVSSFKNFIYFQYDNKYKLTKTNKTPFELMDEAGYILYECHNNDEIMQFKKYYVEGERLCTFRGNRLDRCHVFFAVKKNVDEIKREDFKNPEREDDYGTSVISIQFSRGDVNTLSIKNRYNHTVHNPDATFSNNLENIIPGLTESFTNMYHLNINQEEIVNLGLGYVKADDGKYYKYNLEINGVHYCPDNIIIDHGEVIKDYMDKEKYILMDYFILNLQNDDSTKWLISKSMNPYTIADSFIDGLLFLNKINVIKNKDHTKTIELIRDDREPVYIKIDKYNNIVGYVNNNLKKIDSDFMYYNETLSTIRIDNVLEIDDDFLRNNNRLKSICIPNVKRIGDDFLRTNHFIKSVKLDSVEKIKNRFISSGNCLEYVYMPKLEEVGLSFLGYARKIKRISLPSLKKAGISFMEYAAKLSYLYAPNLRIIEDCFLSYNICLKKIDLPKVERIGHRVLKNNKCLIEINLPLVKEIGNYFLMESQIRFIVLPQVKKIGAYFMLNNIELSEIDMPLLEWIGPDFLYFNDKLISISFPNLRVVGADFLCKNTNIDSVNLPSCINIHSGFMQDNQCLKYLSLPKVRVIEDSFLKNNKSLEYLYAPNLEVTGSCFLYNNKSLKNLSLPSLKSFDAYILEENDVLQRIYAPILSYYLKDKIKLDRKQKTLKYHNKNCND